MFIKKLTNEKKYWLSSNFKEVFDGVEPSKKAPKMYRTILKKPTNDYEIMKTTGVMSKEDLLAIIIDLTEQQDKREDEGLLTNGYANIVGYVEHNGSKWYACVYWLGGEWVCYAGVRLGGDWYAELSFWSRTDTKPLSTDDSLSLGNLESRLTRVEEALKKNNFL